MAVSLSPRRGRHTEPPSSRVAGRYDLFVGTPLGATRPRALPFLSLVTVGLLVLAGCSSTDSPAERDTVIDVLEQDWQHVPGIASEGSGLRVTATARSIVEQDGGGGQPDPPVNLAGTHLEATGDFSLTASFTDVQITPGNGTEAHRGL